MHLQPTIHPHSTPKAPAQPEATRNPAQLTMQSPTAETANAPRPPAGPPPPTTGIKQRTPAPTLPHSYPTHTKATS